MDKNKLQAELGYGPGNSRSIQVKVCFGRDRKSCLLSFVEKFQICFETLNQFV